MQGVQAFNMPNKEVQAKAKAKALDEMEKAEEERARYGVPKRLLFETLSDRRNKKIQRLEEKREYVNVNDHVRRDDDDVTHYVEELATTIRDSALFKKITAVMVLFAILETLLNGCKGNWANVSVMDFNFFPFSLLLRTPWFDSLALTCTGSLMNVGTFEIVGYVTNAFFTVEILMKWYCGFNLFWYDTWCVIDFIAVTPSILATYSPLMKMLRFLVILRMLRLMRFVKCHQKMDAKEVESQVLKRLFGNVSLVASTIVRSISDIVTLLGIMMVFFIFVGIMSVQQARKYSIDFETVGHVVWSCFVIVTQDGWVDIFIRAREQIMPPDAEDMTDYEDRYSAYVFVTMIICIMIVIGGFIFSNLMIALVSTNLDSAIRKEKEDKIKQHNQQNTIFDGEDGAKALGAVGENADDANKDGEAEKKDGEDGGVDKNSGDADAMVSTLPLPQVRKQHTVRAQLNINQQPLKQINVDRIEDYYTMLYALEENLVEYNRLRNQLDEIISWVYRVNSNDSNDLAHQIMGSNHASETKMKPGILASL